MSKVLGLTEVVIWVHDMEKSLSFYRDILGLEVMFQPDTRGAVFLKAGDSTTKVPQQIVLVPLPTDAPEFPTDRTRRTLHHIGIELSKEDFEVEESRLKSMGLELRYGQHPFLPLKGLYLDDPDGNEVELIAPRD